MRTTRLASRAILVSLVLLALAACGTESGGGGHPALPDATAAPQAAGLGGLNLPAPSALLAQLNHGARAAKPKAAS
jgi:hypothetical protein